MIVTNGVRTFIIIIDLIETDETDHLYAWSNGLTRGHYNFGNLCIANGRRGASRQPLNKSRLTTGLACEFKATSREFSVQTGERAGVWARSC